MTVNTEEPPYLKSLLPPELAKPFQWQDIFGSNAPVEVEIGCGKGRFLMARALENPGIHFLGIDRVVKWMKRKIKRTERCAMSNLRFYKAEGYQLLKNMPRESVAAFHIYFPDPWPKRRHRGRRLIDARFLLGLYECLIPGGAIYAATDDLDYYLQIRSAAESLTVPRVIRESSQRMVGPEKTNYELRFESRGLPLYYLEVKK